MDYFKNTFNNSLKYASTLLKWLALSLIVGILGGFIGSGFHISIDYVTELRVENSNIIYLLPVGGIVIAAIYNVFKSRGKLDTNRVLVAATKEEKVPLVMAPLIFAGTVITHLFGGSAGREGAALQLGGSIGYNTGRLLNLKRDGMHVIVMAGMSAVFAALFGTPLTAAFFALEVARVGVMHYVALVPSVFAALVASSVAKWCGLHPVSFSGLPKLLITPENVAYIIGISILCALVSMLFCKSIKKTEQLFDRYMPGAYLKAIVGGGIIVVLTVVLKTYDYNGAGMDVITKAIGGDAKYEAFIIKIIFTSVTIAAGFKGGEIVPAFFIGSTFGCIAGSILGFNPQIAAAVGFVAVFCAVVNCPVASVMLSLEVFGADNILIFALVCAISYMMSGYYGLYHEQKIAFSKLDEEKVDKNTL